MDDFPMLETIKFDDFQVKLGNWKSPWPSEVAGATIAGLSGHGIDETRTGRLMGQWWTLAMTKGNRKKLEVPTYHICLAYDQYLSMAYFLGNIPPKW